MNADIVWDIILHFATLICTPLTCFFKVAEKLRKKLAKTLNLAFLNIFTDYIISGIEDLKWFADNRSDSPADRSSLSDQWQLDIQTISIWTLSSFNTALIYGYIGRNRPSWLVCCSRFLPNDGRATSRAPDDQEYIWLSLSQECRGLGRKNESQRETDPSGGLG